MSIFFQVSERTDGIARRRCRLHAHGEYGIRGRRGSFEFALLDFCKISRHRPLLRPCLRFLDGGNCNELLRNIWLHLLACSSVHNVP